MPTAWQGVKYADVPDGGTLCVLGCEDFATHRIPLDEAPDAYSTFQKKEDGAIKYVIKP